MIKTPIDNGILQSDIDFAGHKPLNMDWAAMPGLFINVTDAPYNAVGDGVANDAAAINQAMADVVAAGGGTVFLPKGVYLCNGLLADYNAILQVPFVNANTQSAVTLQLLGDVYPAHTVYTSFNNTYASTIKTTQTGSGSYPALLAGSFGNGTVVIPPTSMNNLMLTMKNLNFILPDNPSLYGVRIEALGWASLENITVLTTGDSEPTHGTVGIQFPSETNFGLNWANNVFASNFDTGFMTGEHLRAPNIYANKCKTGLAFIESIYPSWANLILTSCVDGVKFIGRHIVDMSVVTEHTGGGWYAPLHDIQDPSNYGTGVIRCFVGNGGGGAATVAPTVNGGTGLTIIDLYAGNIALNTAYGVAGGAAKITGKGCVPPGGTTGQSLKKLSNASYDVGWG